MKPDINLTLNKLIAYSLDNLLLDGLDETYTLNRLATVCGTTAPVRDEDADYGEATLDELLTELTAAAPNVDKSAVMNILFPMPRTVNYYFSGKLARDTGIAIDFLFDLYAHGYKNLSTGSAYGKDGYIAYSDNTEYPMHAVTLPVGEDLVYTPLVVGNHIATLENPDILSDDIINREMTFVTKYGGAIATRVGTGEEYYCCDNIALTSAPVKTRLSDGTVKISLVDYPVPALAFNGIAKNAVAREVARVLKAATEADLPCAVAAAAKDGVTVYLVFANDVKPDEFIKDSTPLTVCGVFKTVDCSELVSVLEKGTALSNELAAFKPIYDKIGGVKLGAKAKNELGGALAEMFIPALTAAATITAKQASALAENKQ